MAPLTSALHKTKNCFWPKAYVVPLEPGQEIVAAGVVSVVLLGFVEVLEVTVRDGEEEEESDDDEDDGVDEEEEEEEEEDEEEEDEVVEVDADVVGVDGTGRYVREEPDAEFTNVAPQTPSLAFGAPIPDFI